MLTNIKTRQARKKAPPKLSGKASSAPIMAGESATPHTTTDAPDGAAPDAGEPVDTSAQADPENVTSGPDTAGDEGEQSADEAGDEADTHAAPTKPAGPIPGMDDRPCWRVFEDWTDPGNGAPKLRPGVWRFGIKTKGEKLPELTQTHVCGPLRVVAVTTNAADGNFGRLLRFKTTLGKWKTWAMPMTMLAGDGIELRAELLYQGLEIDPQARGLLAQFIQDKTPKRRIRCVEQTGWAGGGLAAFVLPDVVIGPDAADVVYQSGEHASDEYTTGGTLAGWQAGIAAQSVGNPLLTLSICAAFSGPLLALCGAESGGIHLFNNSSTGKTTAAEAARSVWGGPGFKRSWNTTANGLEGASVLFNDCLLALDEISQCDPKYIGAIAYGAGNGVGRQRASRTGAARHVKTWKIFIISNGEFSVETSMLQGGYRIKAGQSMRLLDIPVNRKHGAWDTLHSHASGSDMSNDLKAQADLNYGHAGRAFLERLTRDESDFYRALAVIKALPEFATPQDEGGQVTRAASRFALLALAGELATEYGVTGWPEGEAIRAAQAGLTAWKGARGDVRTTQEHRQILERLAEFIEKHGDSRFTDKDLQPDPARAVLIRERAGWFEETPNGRRYLFTSSGLKEALHGFDFERAKTDLHEAGALIGGTVARQARFKDGGNHRVYAISVRRCTRPTAGHHEPERPAGTAATPGACCCHGARVMGC